MFLISRSSDSEPNEVIHEKPLINGHTDHFFTLQYNYIIFILYFSSRLSFQPKLVEYSTKAALPCCIAIVI